MGGGACLLLKYLTRARNKNVSQARRLAAPKVILLICSSVLPTLHGEVGYPVVLGPPCSSRLAWRFRSIAFQKCAAG
jgi:hypothetical protein